MPQFTSLSHVSLRPTIGARRGIGLRVRRSALFELTSTTASHESDAALRMHLQDQCGTGTSVARAYCSKEVVCNDRHLRHEQLLRSSRKATVIGRGCGSLVLEASKWDAST